MQELAVLPHFSMDKMTGEVVHPVFGFWLIERRVGWHRTSARRQDSDPGTGNMDVGFLCRTLSSTPPKVAYERKPIPSLKEMEGTLSIRMYPRKQSSRKLYCFGTRPLDDSTYLFGRKKKKKKKSIVHFLASNLQCHSTPLARPAYSLGNHLGK